MTRALKKVPILIGIAIRRTLGRVCACADTVYVNELESQERYKYVQTVLTATRIRQCIHV
jgi:hypothetical protein